MPRKCQSTTQTPQNKQHPPKALSPSPTTPAPPSLLITSHCRPSTHWNSRIINIRSLGATHQLRQLPLPLQEHRVALPPLLALRVGSRLARVVLEETVGRQGSEVRHLHAAHLIGRIVNIFLRRVRKDERGTQHTFLFRFTRCRYGLIRLGKILGLIAISFILQNDAVRPAQGYLAHFPLTSPFFHFRPLLTFDFFLNPPDLNPKIDGLQLPLPLLKQFLVVRVPLPIEGDYPGHGLEVGLHLLMVAPALVGPARPHEGRHVLEYLPQTPALPLPQLRTVVLDEHQVTQLLGFSPVPAAQGERRSTGSVLVDSRSGIA